MSLHLILIRHAKSDWDDPRLTDHQRPLNPRGRAAAPLIGAWLADHAPHPQQALISSAQRTRETWELASAALPPVAEVTHLDALYHAAPAVMLKVLRAASAPVVAMVGHNPGIAEFARVLLQDAPDHPDFDRYPTAAVLVARFDIPAWADLQHGTGQALSFITPRSIAP